MDRWIKIAGKISLVCLAAIFSACTIGIGGVPSSTPELPASVSPIITQTTAAQETPLTTATIKPVMAFDLAAVQKELGAANALLWLPGNQFAIAGTTEIALVQAPSQTLAPQGVPSIQSTSGVNNPLFLTSSAGATDLAWVSSAQIVQFWQTASSSQPENLGTSDAPVTGLALDPTEKELAYASFEGDITQIVIANRQIARSWKAPAWLSDLSYSPDGQRLGGVNLADFTAYIFTLDGEIEKTLEWSGSASPSLYGAFLSPNWSKIAWVAGSAVQIMDIENGQEEALLNHEDAVSVLAWSPDSRLLATGSLMSEGNSVTPVVYVWDLSSQTVLAALPQMAAVASLSFSPDGTNLAVLEAGGLVHVFTLPK